MVLRFPGDGRWEARVMAVSLTVTTVLHGLTSPAIGCLVRTTWNPRRPRYHDRRAPHVHEPGEREHQEDGHAKKQMDLEDRIDVEDNSAAPGCKVRMPCAHAMNFTISEPSRCCAETGIVNRPSVSWA